MITMKTLVLRFDGPMQSWSVDSKFKTRSAGRWPSRSGIIGMLAAALGMERDADLSAFTSLKIVVRIDVPGIVLPDYHSIRRWDRSGGTSVSIGNALAVSNRYYFEDSIFTVFLQDEDDKIDKYAYAINHPVYSLFLGRKSCPTTPDLVYGVYEDIIENVIGSIEVKKKPVASIRGKDDKYTPIIIRDAKDGEIGDIIKDVPIDYSIRNRQYSGRSVVEESASNFSPENEDIFGFVDERNGDKE